jgi:DNA adenine methylase
MTKIDYESATSAKPFLKWAGGKTQLISEIKKLIPIELNKKKFTYVEPFVGSGAVLFWMLKNYPNMEKAVINDINEDLIKTYKTIKNTPKELIEILMIYQDQFHSLEKDREGMIKYYYEKRDKYNTRESDDVEQAGLFIFLNRTCFNGLYRVNRKNAFNVPMSSYIKPRICDHENIYNVSRALEKVEILCGDYKNTIEYVDSEAFFYFDPPYKPLNDTSSFNSYSKEEFNDDQQIQLREYCDILNKANHRWILSNSDVANVSGGNNFFDEQYKTYNIIRVLAKRSINANSKKRGLLNELLITNQF